MEYMISIEALLEKIYLGYFRLAPRSIRRLRVNVLCDQEINERQQNKKSDLETLLVSITTSVKLLDTGS